jgi:hypothetical protein
MKMEQSVPKRRHIKFRRRGITQKKASNRSEVVREEPVKIAYLGVCDAV